MSGFFFRSMWRKKTQKCTMCVNKVCMSCKKTFWQDLRRKNVGLFLMYYVKTTESIRGSELSLEKKLIIESSNEFLKSRARISKFVVKKFEMTFFHSISFSFISLECQTVLLWSMTDWMEGVGWVERLLGLRKL